MSPRPSGRAAACTPKRISEVLGRATCVDECTRVTCHGRPVAMVVAVADPEALEMALDVNAYREAKAADDGERISVDELRREVYDR